MNDNERARLDALLNHLADDVARRIEERQQAGRTRPEPSPVTAPVPAVRHNAAPQRLGDEGPKVRPATPTAPAAAPAREPAVSPMPVASSHTASSITRLALGVFILVLLINVPLNAQGVALARSVPSSAALIIRNGLLVKEEMSPDIWVYQDETFRWISSLDAFEHFGYRWENVHIVEPGFLDRYKKGKPLSVLLKCEASPHIYRLEAGQKHWIVDIATFEAEGHVWRDVRAVSCGYLSSLPDGESVPPGRDTPPPPLP